jgi:hypothetical protein
MLFFQGLPPTHNNFMGIPQRDFCKKFEIVKRDDFRSPQKSGSFKYRSLKEFTRIMDESKVDTFLNIGFDKGRSGHSIGIYLSTEGLISIYDSTFGARGVQFTTAKEAGIFIQTFLKLMFNKKITDISGDIYTFKNK